MNTMKIVNHNKRNTDFHFYHRFSLFGISILMDYDLFGIYIFIISLKMCITIAELLNSVV